MITNNQAISLKVDALPKREPFKLTQGDSGTNTFTIRVYDGTVEIVYASVTSAIIVFSKPDGTTVQGNMTVGAASLIYTLGANEIAAQGIVTASVQLEGATTERLTIQRFQFEVQRDPVTTDSVVSTTEYAAIKALEIEFEAIDVVAHSADSAIDVKAAPYSAKGDGVTDDTAAIQAALNALTPGRGLYFPDGIYNHNALTCSQNQVSVFGNGAVLYNTDPAEHGLTLSGTDITVHGLTFDADSAEVRNTSGTHLSITGDNAKIYGNTFKNCANINVWIAAGENINVENNIIIGKGLGTGYGGDGVYVSAAGYVNIVGNLFRNVDDDCVGLNWRAASAYQTNHINVIGNMMINGGSRGVSIAAVKDVKVSGNYFDTSALGAVQIYRYERDEFSDEIEVTGNTFENCTSNCTLDQVQNSVVSDNIFRNCGPTSTLLIKNFSNLKILRNTFEDVASRAIGFDATVELTECTDLTIADNIVEGSVNEGIYIVPKSTVVLQNVIITNNILRNCNSANISNYSILVRYVNNLTMSGNVATNNVGQGLISYMSSVTGEIKFFNNLPFDTKTIYYEGRKFTINNPYRSGGSLSLKFQPHCHSDANGGADTPAGIVTAYKNAGYDAVSITDHRVLTVDPSVAGITFILGVEDNVYTQVPPSARHLTAYDISALSDSMPKVQDIIDFYRASSNLCSIAHPSYSSTLINKTEMTSYYDYNLIEVFNQGTGNAEEQWDWALSSGKKVFAIASDDCHDSAGAGFDKAWVVVYSNVNSKDAILQSLRDGNFYASTGNDISVSVSDNVITVSSAASSNFTFTGLYGRVLQTNSGVTSTTYTIKGDELYVRVVSILASDITKIAFSQPIFVDCDGDDNRTLDTLKDLNKDYDAAIGIYRQAIINGGCQIAQRPTATLSSTYQFGQTDRFLAAATGDSVDAGTITNTLMTGNLSGRSLRLTNVTLTGDGKVFVEYRMESCDARYYKNKAGSFSCNVYHNVGSAINYHVSIYKPDAVDDFSAVTLITQSQLQSVEDNTETLVKFENIPLGDCSNGLEIIVRGDCGAVTTKLFYFYDFQFNKGVSVLPFVPKSFLEELQACQRYYEKSYDYQIAPGAVSALGQYYFNTRKALAASTAGGVAIGKDGFKVPKRIIPAVTIYSPGGTENAIRINGTTDRTGATASPTTLNTKGISAIGLDNTSATAIALDDLIEFQWVADAEL
jgi:hypothetical protein